jgi:nicotinamide riboside kinase
MLSHFQKRILNDQIVGEQEALFEGSGFVSDRSTLDNAAYFLAYVASKESPEGVYLYLSEAERNLENYDRLILIPPMFPPVDDGERHTDPREQQRIHEIVCDLIAAWGVAQKVYTVTSRTPEERVAEILEVLGHARKGH